MVSNNIVAQGIGLKRLLCYIINSVQLLEVVELKASLVSKLIEAHCSGDEAAFEKALHNLASDEELKGNGAVAARLRGAYQQCKRLPNRGGKFHTDLVSSQGFLSISSPRDKESMLDLYQVMHSDIRLEDVVLKQEQLSIIHQMINEHKSRVLLESKRLVPSNRLLLCGPPGCGKTMTGMGIANSLGYPVAYVRLDGLVSSYLGQTSNNLRKVFDSLEAQEVVLFLDEFDAIAKKRDDNHELGELKRVVITLLQNFDSMPSNVFLIAATNHEHLLDPAIWRRFNAVVKLGFPDDNQRLQLLTRSLDEQLVGQVDLSFLVRLTQGLSASEIKDTVQVGLKEAVLANRTLDTDGLVSVFIKRSTLYGSQDSEEFWLRLIEMRDKGVSIRSLAEALGIPKSTMSYKLMKGANGDE